MPGFDGTGPLGKGPFSGRGRGFCVMKLPDGEEPEFSLGITGGEEQQTGNFIEKGKEVIAMPAGDRTGPLEIFSNKERSIEMPGGDRTGPAGMGPMTGRATGYCAGYQVPGFMNPIPGRSFGGWGRGGGYGRRNWFHATGLPGWQRANLGMPAFGTPAAVPTISQEQELYTLKGQAEYFEDTLEGIKKRIKELETKAEK